MDTALKIIRQKQLAEILGCSTVTIWRMENNGELPPRRKISKGISGWPEVELIEWLKNRPTVEELNKNDSEDEK